MYQCILSSSSLSRNRQEVYGGDANLSSGFTSYSWRQDAGECWKWDAVAVTNVRSKLDVEMTTMPTISEPPPPTPATKPAPGELEVLRSFVNTYDLMDKTDAIETPDSLCDWLAERGLIARTE